MEFNTVIVNTLLMIAYMICGFLLVKAKKAVSSHARSISGFLIYICGPCMVISAFQSMDYALKDIGKALQFFVVSLLIQLLFFGILYLILHKRYDDAKYRILTAGALFGNVGFLGLPLVTGLFPNEPVVACYSTLYVTSMNFLVFTIGVYLIKHDRRYISVRSLLLNPTTIAVAIALPLYFLQFHFPPVIGDTIALFGKMTTPICMIVLGMRLASMKLKLVFTKPFAYFTCLLKMIVFPLFAYLCVLFLPWFDDTFKISLCILSACPSAAIVLSLSELHDCEQELSANVVLLTTLCTPLVIPLLLLLIT